MIAYGEPWRGRLLEEPLGPGESLRRLHTAVRARYGRHPHLPELVRTLIEEHAGIEYLAADEGRGGPYWFGRCLCHEDDGAPTMELIDAGLLPYPQDPPGLRPWGIDPEESIWLLRPGSQIAEDLGWMLHLGEREITLKARDRREHDRFTPVLTVRLDEDPAWRMLIQIADDSGNALLDGAVDYEAIIGSDSPEPALRGSEAFGHLPAVFVPAGPMAGGLSASGPGGTGSGLRPVPVCPHG